MAKFVLASAGIILAGLLICCGGFFWLISPSYRPIGNFDFGEGVAVRVWSEGDWDLDHIYPAIYYEVTDRGRVVVPQTMLDIDTRVPMEFRAASAGTGDGKVYCVYEASKPRDCHDSIVILYAPSSRQTWPRDEGGLGQPSRQKLWRERYQRLLDELPELPVRGGPS